MNQKERDIKHLYSILIPKMNKPGTKEEIIEKINLLKRYISLSSPNSEFIENANAVILELNKRYFFDRNI